MGKRHQQLVREYAEQHPDVAPDGLSVEIRRIPAPGGRDALTVKMQIDAKWKLVIFRHSGVPSCDYTLWNSMLGDREYRKVSGGSPEAAFFALGVRDRFSAEMLLQAFERGLLSGRSSD